MATILVVDDRATNREVARATLDGAGHHVLEAADGGQALELARQLHPDAVLADVVMPGMDGYQFVQQLHADARTADIPVLFYSANYRPDEAQPLATAYGVTKVISKSADPEDLLAAVEQALHDTSPAAPTIGHLGDEHLRMVNAKLIEKVLELDESQARFDALADVSPVGIVSGNADLHATYVNPHLVEITGMARAELLGHGWLRCLRPDNREQLRRHGVSTDSVTYYNDIRSPGGGQRWIQTTVRGVDDGDAHQAGFVATIDDVTALVEAEQRRHAHDREREIAERRRIAERFDSLARLSGAVAHDFNNMLNVILSFSDFTAEAIRDSIGASLTSEHASPMLHDLDRVGQAGKRAAHLAHQLLTFGGREVVEPTVLDPRAIVEEVRGMVDATLGRRIIVTTTVAPQIHNIVADGNQLTQVLLNLAINARDAMPHGGCLTIEAQNVPTNARPAALPEGDWVHIAVQDTGEGMTAEVAERAMEPFFTTKPRGQGTGLGLATAYGIVRQASGELIIETAPGRGTTIHLYLPGTNEPTPAATPETGAEIQPGLTILVADDEDGVREVARRILSKAGYTVLTASNGQEAMEIAMAHPGRIHGVLSDVVMPHMNGPQLAEALRIVRPDTPVLYMSGYAEPLMSDEGRLAEGVTVVSKPFTKQELLSAVSEIFRTSGQRAGRRDALIGT